jgi:two-component system phosphate regulon sensor histidine kinase PhoR
MDLLALLIGVAIGFAIGAWERFRLKNRLRPLLTVLPDTSDVANSLSLTSLVRREILHLSEQCQQAESELTLCKSLLDQAPISYLWVDGENHLLQCNQACRELLQIDRWQAGQLRLLLELVRSYELDQLIQQTRLEQQCQVKEWIFYPLPGKNSDPQQNLATQSLKLRGYSYGLPQQQVVVFLENLQPLVELSLQRDRAFSDLTHELRTPLTAISLVAETLHHRLQGTERKWVEQMLMEIDRLKHFVENWLNLTQIKEKSSQFLHCESVNLQDLIHSSWQRLEPLAQEKQVTLNYQSEDSEPILINGDRDRLMQVFLNLFDNSLKYSPTQGIVRVTVKHTQALLQIQIIDQGAGFNLVDLPHIFDRLYRGDPSRTRQGLTQSRQGSGLGLAIAKEIIELHGGSIQAENDPQTGGACLTLCLPLISENSSY